MQLEDNYIKKGKFVLTISAIFLIVAMIGYAIQNINFTGETYQFNYETVDIKTMAVAKVSLKKSKTTIISDIIHTSEEDKVLTEINLEEPAPMAKKLEVTKEEPVVLKPTWRLPTEQGYITQYAHYGHIALDITSSRGTNERIYPVADGVVTSIFNDAFGAKIVTINHYIDGKYYTSEYVHLSWYAEGLHVGQQVTTDTFIGGMGATGIATGVHLHLTVLDCNLYSPSEPHCSNIGRFYDYGRSRLLQGFKGLDNLMPVPQSWYSR